MRKGEVTCLNPRSTCNYLEIRNLLDISHMGGDYKEEDGLVTAPRS
jgi:hypothetical protein